MMKNFFLNFFLGIVFFMPSCTKEVRDNTLEVLSGEETLLSKMKQIEGAATYVSLSSHTEGLGHHPKNYRLDASLGTKHLEIWEDITINKSIVMERYVPSPELGLSNQFIPKRIVSRAEFTQLFGKKIEVSMNAKSNQVLETRTLTSGSIITPDEIELAMPSGTPINSPNGSNSLSVPRNALLQWNPDPNNRSVYILVLFDPRSVRNFRHKGAPRKTAFHTVRDNGRFTIPARDFEGIPMGAHIEIVVARGNTALIGGSSNGMGSTALLTYSMATINGSTGSGGNSCNTCIEVQP